MLCNVTFTGAAENCTQAEYFERTIGIYWRRPRGFPDKWNYILAIHGTPQSQAQRKQGSWPRNAPVERCWSIFAWDAPNPKDLQLLVVTCQGNLRASNLINKWGHTHNSFAS